MHTHWACDMENSLSLKSLIPAQVPFEPSQRPHPQTPSRKDGKTNDYNGVFAFFLGPKKTQRTRPVTSSIIWLLCQWEDSSCWRDESGGEGDACVWGVKRATEMAGDEDGPALTAITHVAWSYGPISTKTNYRRGNFTDRKNLSPSGTLPLRDFTQPLWASLRRENSLRGQQSNTPRAKMDGEEDMRVISYKGVVLLLLFHTDWRILCGPITCPF